MSRHYLRSLKPLYEVCVGTMRDAMPDSAMNGLYLQVLDEDDMPLFPDVEGLRDVDAIKKIVEDRDVAIWPEGLSQQLETEMQALMAWEKSGVPRGGVKSEGLVDVYDQYANLIKNHAQREHSR